MQSSAGRRPSRILVQRLLMACVALLVIQQLSVRPVLAGNDSPAHSSVVLVLKLVSRTHVKPVTGIVVSNDGLVVVPAAFVTGQGEIIVLDGGTDIVSNGRPARVLGGEARDDLALLSVEGLSRPGIRMSRSDLQSPDTLHLLAFPPADEIAKGALPLWVPVELATADSTGLTAISPDTPLPNVTGPILDNCGHLAGLSLADGRQSLETDKTTTAILGMELADILIAMKVNLLSTSCVESPDAAGAETAGPEIPGSGQLGRNEQEEFSKVSPKPEPVEETGPVTEISTGDAGLAENSGTRGATGAATDIPPLWRMVPVWLYLLSGIVLVVLAWKITLSLRHGRTVEQEKDGVQTTGFGGLASDEPDTMQLQPDSDAASIGSLPVGDDRTKMPDMNALPDGRDGVLVIEGVLGDDTRFNRFCNVNTREINVVIGRGNADVSIEHAAISRAHIRIEGNGETMTVSDLGSSNGTFIRGIPCLQGEIMFVGSADELLLGDVRLCIRLDRRETDQS